MARRWMARRSMGMAGRAYSVVFVIVLVMVFFTTFRIAPVQGASLGLQVVRGMDGAAWECSGRASTARADLHGFVGTGCPTDIAAFFAGIRKCYAVPVLPDLGNVKTALNGVTYTFMKSANG